MRRGWVLVGVVVLGGCGSSPLGSGGPDSAADAGLDAAGPDAAGDGPAAEHAIDAPLDVPDGGGAPDGGGLCQIGGSDGGASYPRGMRLRSVARAGDPLLADV